MKWTHIKPELIGMQKDCLAYCTIVPLNAEMIDPKALLLFFIWKLKAHLSNHLYFNHYNHVLFGAQRKPDYLIIGTHSSESKVCIQVCSRSLDYRSLFWVPQQHSLHSSPHLAHNHHRQTQRFSVSPSSTQAMTIYPISTLTTMYCEPIVKT